jgi:hypothetical protein|tara:strand:- start:392 stop:3709 length:3318 start_codon:yes stop_codon:yes gene_type:complete
MPDLNIKGNVLEDFGVYLPTPIIETINVYNNYIEVGVSLYINFSDPAVSEGDITAYMQSMVDSPIYVYVARVLGKEIIEKFVSTENPDIFGGLYPEFIDSTSGDTTTATRLLSVTNQDITDMHSNYVQLQFTTQNFTLSTQNFYDDQNNRVLQFTTTLRLPISFVTAAGSVELGLGRDSLNAPGLMGAQYGLADSLRDLTIFAFTSIMDLDSAETSNEGTWIPTGYIMADNQIYSESYKLNLMPHLATQVVSNIAYEPVYKEGILDSSARLAYVDSDGGTYNDIPIQAINGKLYKQNGYSLEQIVALFETYISGNKTDDSDVQEMLDNIAYIIATYGTSSELLIQLNILRTSFPNKSTATPVGRLYAAFKSRFFGANEKVVTGTPVSEQLYKSSKVKGYTDTGEASYSIHGRSNFGEAQAPYAKNFIYIYKEGDSAEVERGDWMSSVQVYREGAYGNPDPDEFIKSGFWFFDYTWALKQYARICDFFRLSELKYILSDYEIHNFFRLKEVQMQSWYWPVGTTEVPAGIPTHLEWFPTDINDYEWKWTLTAPITYHAREGLSAENIPGEGTKSIAVPSVVQRLTQQQIDESGYDQGHTLEVANGVDVDLDPKKTFIIARGVQGTLIDDSHGLVCFQFQDTAPCPGYVGGVDGVYETPDDRTVYTFQVTVEDTSIVLLDQIVNSFVEYFNNDFKDYYDLAHENCNYNQQDGTFNEFFKEGIIGHYGDDESQYPWIRMPLLFAIHSRLMTGQSAALGHQSPEEAFSDESTIEAATIAGTINPINGSLASLKAFYERCEALIHNYYGEGTPMANALEGQIHHSTGEILAPTTTIIRGSTNTAWTAGNEYLWSAPPPPLSTVEGAGWTYEPPAEPEPAATWPPEPEPSWYWDTRSFIYKFDTRFQTSGVYSELDVESHTNAYGETSYHDFPYRLQQALLYWDAAWTPQYGNDSFNGSYGAEQAHASSAAQGADPSWAPEHNKDYQGAFDILTEWISNNDTGDTDGISATHLGINVDRNSDSSVPFWSGDEGGHPATRSTPLSREWLQVEINENEGYVRIVQHIWNDAVSAFNQKYGFPSDVGFLVPDKFYEEYADDEDLPWDTPDWSQWT